LDSCWLDPDKIEDHVKVISLPKKVYDGIKDTVMDDDFSDVEFYNFGDDVVNFKLTLKKNSGGHNDYSGSKFEIKPKELDLADEDIDVIAEKLKDLSTLFEVHSLDEFNEAIEIEQNGDKEDSEPKQKKVTKKPQAAVNEEDEDSQPKVVKRSVPQVESTDEDDEEDAEDSADSNVGTVSDIKTLRSGILSKLMSKEEA